MLGPVSPEPATTNITVATSGNKAPTSLICVPASTCSIEHNYLEQERAVVIGGLGVKACRSYPKQAR